MLRLKNIEVSGFKSFVDPVATEFAPGITAIVGPNGCGKSNLSEAITWVLGEQSAKSLRGGRMEDVIFGGTDRRKPLGMAEVALTLQLEDPSEATELGLDPADQGRITIGRRVFRTGESQYRINDRQVRLKHIKDLLADTGLGVRAYSVIEQGRIGQILSSKPQERRKLIEEAAGITRYKARKRLSELKLEEATANQMRLDDIISEVERALRSLKRQSNAAVRFKTVDAEYRRLLRLVLEGRWDSLGQQLLGIDGQIEVLRDGDRNLLERQTGLQSKLTEAKQRLDATSTELAGHERQSAELNAQMERLKEQLRGSGKTRADLEERLADGERLALKRRTDIATQQRQQGELQGRGKDLETEREDAEKAVAESNELIAGASSALATAERAQEEVRSQLMSSLAQVNTSQNKLHQLQIQEEKATYRRDHLRTSIDEKRQQLDATTSDHETAQHNLGELERRVESKSQELESTKAALDEVLQKESAGTTHRSELETERAMLDQRRVVLEEIDAEERDRRGDLLASLNDLGLSDTRLLEDVLSVPSGWEETLDLFLSAYGDIVVLPAETDPLPIARSLRERGLEATLLVAGERDRRPIPRELFTTPDVSGSASRGPGDAAEAKTDSAPSSRSWWQALFEALQSLFGQRTSSEAEPPPPEPVLDPAVVGALAEHAGLPDDLAGSLPEVYLVRSEDDALRLARRCPGASFLAEGGVAVSGGLVQMAAEVAQPGALARARELRELRDHIPKLAAEIEKASQELDELLAERTRLAELREATDTELTELRQEHAVAVARRQDAANRKRETEAQHQSLLDERTEVEEELQSIAERKTRLQQELASDQKAHEAMDQRFDHAQQRVAKAREERDAQKHQSTDRKGLLKVVAERLTAWKSETRQVAEQISSLAGALSTWSQEKERLSSRQRELQGETETAREQLRVASREREQAQLASRRAGEALQQDRNRVQHVEEQLGDLRDERDHNRGLVEELRVEQASVRQEIQHLVRELRANFGEDALEQTDIQTPESEELEGLQDQLDEQKRILDRIGPVNVLAADEYDEQKERHEFLTQQRADVEQSIQTLRQTIREINQTSQQRFIETFTEVNKSFNETFAELFRGGEASMNLLDEDDPLESGLEIVARPPGKRLQSILLMSGGEKALTAIALLFALFRTKPSPFCILDEVDAPLDDVNVLRFVEMLRRMSEDTQFLVVTHNKLTMEAANILYGVTMAEKGVSKLVGVDIDDIHPSQLAS